MDLWHVMFCMGLLSGVVAIALDCCDRGQSLQDDFPELRSLREVIGSAGGVAGVAGVAGAGAEKEGKGEDKD